MFSMATESDFGETFGDPVTPRGEVQKDAAKEATVAAAFTCSDGRVIVHSILNNRIGADWDLADVLALIDDQGSDVYWTEHWIGHELQVQTASGWRYNFDVKRPVPVGGNPNEQ